MDIDDIWDDEEDRGLREELVSGVKLSERACTCHPDDKPPVPCPKKYALSECRIAALEARLAFADKLLDQRDAHISELNMAEEAAVARGNRYRDELKKAEANTQARSEQEPVALVDSNIIRDGKSGPVIWFNGYPPNGTKLYAAPVDTQAAIDAALESVLVDLQTEIDPAYLFDKIKSRIGTNPLAEVQKDAERWKHARIDARVAAIYCQSALAPGKDVDAAIDAAIQENRDAIQTTKT